MDLGTLTWERSNTGLFLTTITSMKPATTTEQRIQGLCCARYPLSSSGTSWDNLENKHMQKVGQIFGVKDLDYTTATDFKTAMSGVLLCYELEDPTQGNTIAIKTDDGSGINGTMAVFSTGTPLQDIPDTNVRDVMAWDGSAGEVTKNCMGLDLGTLNWTKEENHFYSEQISDALAPSSNSIPIKGITPIYTITSYTLLITEQTNNVIAMSKTNRIYVYDTNYTDPADFKAAMQGVMLVYELATPTTQPLTSTENASLAGLKTFEPTTHAQNNAGAEMAVEAYAGTANGKAVNELKQDVRSEIATQTAAQLALIAVPYDSTATYNAGDYVIEGGKLYKCSTPVSTAEPFDPTKWTATTVMAEIA